MHLVLELDRSALRDEEVPEAMARAIEIMRNRVDRFGVAEPSIQRQGEDRMVIELPGSARQGSGDQAGRPDGAPRVQAGQGRPGRAPGPGAPGPGAGRRSRPPGSPPTPSSWHSRHPLTDLMPYWPDLPYGGSFVPEVDFPKAKALLATVNVDSILPIDTQVLWGKSPETYQGTSGRILYVIDRRPQLTGRGLANAVRRVGGDPTRPQRRVGPAHPECRGHADLPARDGAEHRPVAGDRARRPDRLGAADQGAHPDRPGVDHRHLHRRRGEGPGDVLQAGALPAPVNIIQEMTVGASLGTDSIRRGTNAALIGAAARRHLHDRLLPGVAGWSRSSRSSSTCSSCSRRWPGCAAP